METTNRNNIDQSSDIIYVISGLPRSGTSMMMNILYQGGIPLVIDNIRQPNEDNPEGYFELEDVKQLPGLNNDWLEKSKGRAVKIIATLLPKIPDCYVYKVIFMRRNLQEIIASQKRMLQRNNQQTTNVSDHELKIILEKHLNDILGWIKSQNNIDLLEVNYNEIITQPRKNLKPLMEFLDRDLDIEKMVQVVNPDLYRQR